MYGQDSRDSKSSRRIAVSYAEIEQHGPYPGQKATSGNFAYGIGGKMEIELGPCAQFSIYHLMQLKEGEERLKLNSSSSGLFNQHVEVIQASASSAAKSEVQQFKVLDEDVETKRAPDSPKKSFEHVYTNPKTLGDISKLLRSKNAGPFEVTLDVMFDCDAEYRLVKASGFLTITTMAQLFEIREDDIIWEGFFDQALAYKVTIPRMRKGKPAASGGYMENDVHASQQYIGLMNMALPEVLIERWNRLHEG